MFSNEVIQMLVKGIGETVYMTLASTLFGYLFGLPMGILLTISDKEGIRPNAVLYKILDVIANIVRSVPFLILLIVYKVHRGEELRFHGYNRTSCGCGGSLHSAYGRVVSAGSGCRGD